MPLPGLNTVLSLAIQYYCMEITKQTDKFFNPDQIPIDTCHQLVYALTKEYSEGFLGRLDQILTLLFLMVLILNSACWLSVENQ